MAAQSLHSKVLAVGLGGTGKRTLVHLKRKFLEQGIDTAVHPKVNLLCIDFDSGDEKIAAPSDGDVDSNVVELEDGETLYLSTEEIGARLRDMESRYNERHYASWYPDIEGETIEYGLAQEGAAQWRTLGRVGLYENVRPIHETLRKEYEDLTRIRTASGGTIADDPLSIYLVTSIGGGTGAGTLIDVAYYLNDIAPNVPLYGLLVLPDVYKTWDQHGRLYCNSYALMKEMAMILRGTLPFEAHYPNGTSIETYVNQQPPFNGVFLFDEQVGEASRADASQLVDYIAESIFVNVYESSISGSERSHLTNLTQKAGKSRDELSRHCVFHVMGSTSVVFPDMDEIRDYFVRRFAVEFVYDSLSQRGDELSGVVEAAREGSTSSFEYIEASSLGVTVKETRNRIDQAVSDLKAELTAWSTSDYSTMAGKMYRRIKGQRSDFDATERDVKQWLHALVHGDPLPIPPLRLPREGASDTDRYNDIIEAFKDDLEERMRNLRASARGAIEEERLDAALRETYQAVARRLREQNEADREEAWDRVVEPGSAYETWKSSLKQLIDANPWSFMNQSEMGFQSLLQRFFQKVVWPIYKDYIREARINAALAKAIEDVIGRVIETDQRDVDTVSVNLTRIRKTIRSETVQIRDRLVDRTRQNRLSQSYVTDEAFVEALWKRVQKAAQDMVVDADEMSDAFERFAKDQGIPDIGQHGNVNEVVQAFFDFAKERVNPLIDRLMQRGELDPLRSILDDRSLKTKFKQYLRRAKNDYFLNNSALNRNQTHYVLISVPFADGVGGREREIDRLRDVVSDVFLAPKMDVSFSSDSNRLVVKYVSMNHPAQNLKPIAKMHRTYVESAADPAMFHIHRNYADRLENLYEEPISEMDPIFCGNPGCEYDLARETRRRVLCPGCDEPIRSRCGNEECTANNLDDTDRYPQLESENPPKYCPACNQNLRTYWSECNIHPQPFRTDLRNCPECMERYQADRIAFPYAMVNTVDGVKKEHACPGCLHDGRSPADATRIVFAGAYADEDLYYEVGPEQVRTARRIFFENPMPAVYEGKCNRCSATMMPVCPMAPSEKPHFLSRGSDGHFRCLHDPVHAREKFFECATCAFPMTESAAYCPRCKSEVLTLGASGYPIEFAADLEAARIVPVEGAPFTTPIDEEWALADEWIEAQQMRWHLPDAYRDRLLEAMPSVRPLFDVMDESRDRDRSEGRPAESRQNESASEATTATGVAAGANTASQGSDGTSGSASVEREGKPRAPENGKTDDAAADNVDPLLRDFQRKNL